MTQPTFVPFADNAAVRPTMATATPEIGRPKKAGLLGAPTVSGGSGQGTPGPDAGFALSLAERALEHAHLEGESHHDLVLAVALLAAKRAALVGRAPTSSDVTVAMNLLGIGSSDALAAADRRRRVSGIGHSYFLQRRFVDAVSDAALSQRADDVVALVRFSD